MKKRIKEVELLIEQYMKDEISKEEFEQKRQSIDKKYEILMQEKIVKGYVVSVYFNIFAAAVCGFISISNIIDGNIIPFITNGILTIFNLINLCINIKKLNKSKIKLIKDYLT
mgnify:CR=1 FL=1